MTAVNPFEPAVKAQIKARVAFAGPTGSGKTWTALGWATTLAGPEGAQRRENGLARVAFIDTERRSASLYAPHFTFDVLNMAPPYEVPKLLANLRAAEANGYSVVVIDSMSHFWEGEGGVLDLVDTVAAQNRGNKFDAWRVGTPMQRNMVDTILGLDMHVIACMRAKMAYVQAKKIGRDGEERTVIEKLGEQPVQRSGMEYEFQIVGDLDLQHRITISKSRCDILADRVIQPHREREAAKEFLDWLDTGEPVAEPEEVAELVSVLDTITDKDERVKAKQLFVECFGKPNELLASLLDEAREWVHSYVAPPAAPENATQQGTGDDGPASEGDASSGGEPTPETGPLDAATGEGADSHDVGRTEPEPVPDTTDAEIDPARIAKIEATVAGYPLGQVRTQLEGARLPLEGTPKQLRERLAQHLVNQLVAAEHARSR